MPLMPSRVQRVLGPLMCDPVVRQLICDIRARIAAGAGAAMTRSEHLAQYLDGASWAGGPGQPGIPGEQKHSQGLSDGYVGGIVDG